MTDALVTLTDATFDEQLKQSPEPYLVDFWADWCEPCVALEPIITELATEQQGKLRVGRLNILEHPEVAERFGVMTVPTMIVFRDGEVAKRMFGAKSKRVLLIELEDFIT